jgi:hypothetical protein
MTSSINTNPAFVQEWKALSSTDDILFFNKNKKQLENMTYANNFTRFFKIIWYYLCGYTRNTNTVFKGMEDLLKRSIVELQTNPTIIQDKLPEFLETVKKVHEFTMKVMIEEFEKDEKKVHSLAAVLIRREVEDFLKFLNRGKENQLTPSSKPASPILTEAQIDLPLTPSTKENATLQSDPLPQSKTFIPPLKLESPVNSDAMPSPSIPQTPSSIAQPPPFIPITPGSGAPKAPPMMANPEQIKKDKIAKLEKDIDQKKKLVNYLELLELQKSSKQYHDYKKSQMTLEMYLSKVEDHDKALGKIGFQKLDTTVQAIQSQLANGEQKISIGQDGVVREYDHLIALEVLKEWKALRDEIQETNENIKKFTTQKEKLADNAVVLNDETMKLFGEDEILAKLTRETKEIKCKVLESHVKKLEKELAKDIEENKDKLDMKAQSLLQFNLENQKRKLNGLPALSMSAKKLDLDVLKKPGSQITKSGSQLDKDAVSGIAAQAAEKKLQKAATRPSLFKL